MGVEFFRRVVEYQQRYANGKRIANAFQTNGTLLDEAWCEFLRKERFLVGLSIDGPRDLHDRYRVDRKGQGTFDQVMRGMGLLKKHGVDFNTLCVVSRANSQRPLDVYRFLKTEGSGFIQFIPLVERLGEDGKLAEPAGVGAVTPWSVEAMAFGNFLCAVFDEWVRHDVGRVFVQLFDVQLGIWMGMPAALCVFNETCGTAMALEHNGDAYSCDHYVYPRYRLGNITGASLRELVDSAQQQTFGQAKRDTLPRYCRECNVRFACNGECPKHRFLETPDGERGLNYLCAGYKKFFRHIDRHMTTMAQLLGQGYPAAQIMGILAREGGDGGREVGRNAMCPCGSGKKYKRCCGNGRGEPGPADRR
jgi:uncharacterized protein